jgi:hypothetical protein
MKDHFVFDVVCFIIEHHQMYTHHHIAWVEKMAKNYHEVQGFNNVVIE